MIYPKLKKPSMVQMSGDGSKIEAPITGAQRIYSRQDTAKMVSMASTANSMGELLALGKFIMEATKTQDATPPEYTDN